MNVINGDRFDALADRNAAANEPVDEFNTNSSVSSSSSLRLFTMINARRYCVEVCFLLQPKRFGMKLCAPVHCESIVRNAWAPRIDRCHFRELQRADNSGNPPIAGV
jgi:hypothetical protein